MSIRELDSRYIVNTYRRMDFVPEKAEGCYLYQNGRAYLDLFSGLAVNVLGHRHPAVVRAIERQCDRFMHISNYFYNRPAVELARLIVDNTIRGKVFFTNSGTEATEAAIKAISKYGSRVGRRGIVVMRNSFHGRTTGALKLTRQETVRRQFPQVDYPVYEVTPNDLDQLAAVVNEKKPAAVLLESVLGSGGVITASKYYLLSCQDLCRETQTLFALDEIQTGMGRTGYLFSFQEFNLRPDLFLFAKGVGGGLPLGGVVFAEPWDELFSPGDHGSTFAPSPVAAAAGAATLQVIVEDGFLPEVRTKAAWLKEKLKELAGEFEVVEEVRGRGMMQAIVLALTPSRVSAIQSFLLNEGFLVNITQGRIIRLLPPLIIGQDDLGHFVLKLREALTKISEGGEE